MKRKLLIIVIMWLFAMSAANAQTGTWSGKLDVQGTKLSLVFHLDEKTCIEAVEGVNHLFQHCSTGTISEYGEIEETISPAVLETIIQWIL